MIWCPSPTASVSPGLGGACPDLARGLAHLPKVLARTWSRALHPCQIPCPDLVRGLARLPGLSPGPCTLAQGPCPDLVRGLAPLPKVTWSEALHPCPRSLPGLSPGPCTLAKSLAQGHLVRGLARSPKVLARTWSEACHALPNLRPDQVPAPDPRPPALAQVLGPGLPTLASATPSRNVPAPARAAAALGRPPDGRAQPPGRPRPGTGIGGGRDESERLGLNLSGSWQQGHSATYNTQSRI